MNHSEMTPCPDFENFGVSVPFFPWEAQQMLVQLVEGHAAP